MAKRFTKPSINWVQFEKKVPQDQKGKYMAFKTKSDSYLRRVLANPPEPPKINWDEYRKIMPDEGIIDKFKSAYEEFKVPYPDDTLTTKVDEQWKSLEPQIKAFCAEHQKDIDMAQKELNRIKALPKYDDMTLEMFYDLYPEVALDPVNKPTFWPHNAEEQPGYVKPVVQVAKEAKTVAK